MEKKRLALALLLTFVWGINFPITRLGLDSFDPFVLTVGIYRMDAGHAMRTETANSSRA